MQCQLKMPPDLLKINPGLHILLWSKIIVTSNKAGIKKLSGMQCTTCKSISGSVLRDKRRYSGHRTQHSAFELSNVKIFT